MSPKMQLIENYIDEALWLIVLCPYLNEENTVTSDLCTGYHECSFYSLVFITCTLTTAIQTMYAYIVHLLYGQPSSLCFSSHKRNHFTKVIP